MQTFHQKILFDELAARSNKNQAYSMRAFARSLQVNSAIVSRVLSGQRSLSSDVAERICDKLNLPVDQRRRFIESVAVGRRSSHKKSMDRKSNASVESEVERISAERIIIKEIRLALALSENADHERAFLILNEKGDQSIWYVRGDHIRPASAIEKKIQFESQDNIFWSPDKSSAFVSKDFSFSGRKINWKFLFLTESQSQDKSVEIDLGEGFRPFSYSLFARDGRFFLVTVAGKKVDASSSQKFSSLYEISHLITDKPVSSLILTTPGANQWTFYLGLDQKYAYFNDHGKIKSVHLTDHHVSPELAVCSDANSVQTLSSPAFQYQRVYIACDHEILTMSDSKIIRRMGLKGPIQSGRILADDGQNIDLILTHDANTLERLRTGQDSIVSKLNVPEPIPSGMSKTMWDEDGSLCGVIETYASSTMARSVFCQRDGQWIPANLTIGTPGEVLHTGPTTWAMSHIGENWELFAKATQSTNSKWVSVQSWSDQTFPPKIIPSGNTGIAIDFGKDSIWTQSGQQFVESHRHDRSLYADYFKSAIDSAGNFYDLCKGTSAKIFSLCVIKPDGITDTILHDQVDNSSLVLPLQRGVLYTDLQKMLVIRDRKVIPIDTLFGELRKEFGVEQRLVVFPLGYGQVHLYQIKKKSSDYTFKYDHFVFDGSHLVRLSPEQENYLESRPNFDTRSKPIFWQGSDKIWRFVTGNEGLRKIKYGRNPKEAIENNSSNPNQILTTQTDRRWVTIGNSTGLWQCPMASGTLMTPKKIDFMRTTDCHMLWAAPYVDQIFHTPHGYVVKQGDRIVTIGDLHHIVPMSLSGRGHTSQLFVTDDQATWLEDDEVVSYNFQNHTTSSVKIPIDSSHIQKLQGRWFCATEGLFRLDKNDAGSHWVKALDSWSLAEKV